MSTIFTPRKPRHVVLRMAFGLLGLAVLTVLLVFGVMIGAAMLTTGLLYKLISNARGKTAAGADGHIVEGEYRVVQDKPVLPLSR